MLVLRWVEHIVAFPRRSNWVIGSPSDITATLGTPEIDFAIAMGGIRIPLLSVEKRKIIERIKVEGGGAGLGLSVGLQTPFFNGDISPGFAPGTGSSVFLGFGAPNPMQASDFNGPALVTSASHANTGFEASFSLVLFLYTPHNPLLSVIDALNVKAAAICASTGATLAMVNVGGEAMMYDVHVTHPKQGSRHPQPGQRVGSTRR